MIKRGFSSPEWTRSANYPVSDPGKNNSADTDYNFYSIQTEENPAF
jgi:hypothetical protein